MPDSAVGSFSEGLTMTRERGLLTPNFTMRSFVEERAVAREKDFLRLDSP